MVSTQPHGSGDVNEHINPTYDPDEDGLIELIELDRDLTTDAGAVVYDYTAGQVPDPVIPDVDALSYTGAFADAQIPDVDTLSYTGAFAPAQIPDLVDHAVAHTPTNLAGTVGAYDGAQAVDDGTNTAARGTLCIWDDVNGVWRPSNDPAVGAFS